MTTIMDLTIRVRSQKQPNLEVDLRLSSQNKHSRKHSIPKTEMNQLIISRPPSWVCSFEFYITNQS